MKLRTTFVRPGGEPEDLVITADADAMHVRLADHAVCIGPPAASDSYLNVANIISAAEITASTCTG
mgnify:CR=1 FL=1